MRFSGAVLFYPDCIRQGKADQGAFLSLQADDKMRRSGSNTTSDTTGLNRIPPPNVTSPSPQHKHTTHIHNTSTDRDPRETAISAALSWSLFKKQFGWNSKLRTELCLSPGVEGTWSHHKDIQASSRGKAKKEKNKPFYIGSYHHTL